MSLITNIMDKTPLSSNFHPIIPVFESYVGPSTALLCSMRALYGSLFMEKSFKVWCRETIAPFTLDIDYKNATWGKSTYDYHIRTYCTHPFLKGSRLRNASALLEYFIFREKQYADLCLKIDSLRSHALTLISEGALPPDFIATEFYLENLHFNLLKKAKEETAL